MKNPHTITEQTRPAVGTRQPCPSTGGVIEYTKTGIIHTGGQRYTGAQAQKDLDTAQD